MTFPVLEAKEFSIDTDPSGTRQLITGNGFVKYLNTSAGGQLLFNPLDITTSGGISETHVLLYRVSDYGSASGVFNMKFFLTSTSAWTTGSYRFLQKIDQTFVPNIQLSEDDDDTPVSIPASQNLFATDGSSHISGVQDVDVSQYIYLAALAREDTTVGIKGGAGIGSYRYRMLYDFS